jgi:hypothetical protein
LASGGTVSSSREATSQVGVSMWRSSSSVIIVGPPGASAVTTPQIGTDAANSSGYTVVIFRLM